MKFCVPHYFGTGNGGRITAGSDSLHTSWCSAGFTGRGKTQIAVILSETKNLSLLFGYTQIEERYFASLRMT
jgi:hypothetical protein